MVAVACVSAVPLIALIMLLRGEQRLVAALPYLVSLAVGGLLGAAMFHLVPEALEQLGPGVHFSAGVLGGFLGFMLLERFLRLHRHPRRAEDTGVTSVRPAPYAVLNLIGDAAHNFMDGAIIAAAFVTSPELGFATTVAVLLHEVPQEIGDFAVLVHGGYAPRKAIALNVLVALAAFGGALAMLLAGARTEAVVQLVLPISAGSFIYIAASDLIPELQHETRVWPSVAQLALLFGGALLMLVLA
jgi:zinc and cadmium transporter